jgi:L-amino acid N-acyltransferase YncA
MIRKATRFDKIELIEMLNQFGNEFLPKYVKYFKPKTVDKLLTSIIAGAGIALIEEGKGLIVGVMCPCLYDENLFILNEVAWYAKPEYRSTTVGYRLFKTYIDEANKMIEEKRIIACIMNKLHNSPDIHYEKYGFKKSQESWIK